MQRARRLLDAQEVGLERLHARGREQDRGVEARRHERPAGQAQVAARLEEAQEHLADLVGGHAAIVAHPSTASPRRKTAVWPGAGPSTGWCSSIVSPRSVHGDRRRAVAQLDRLHLGGRRVQARVAHAHVARRQRGPRADGHGVGARVGAHHVERLRRAADLQAAALADGELMRAAVAPQDAPGDVDDVARALAQPAVAGQERRAPGTGQEAQVLRVGRGRHRQLVLGGDRAHLRLLEVAEREAQARERRARQPGEHVGLVLGRVGGQAQQALGRAARVVPGGQRGGADAVGEGEHGVQAHVAVAAHARVGGQPGGVVGQPRLDDAGAELVAQVEGEVREAHAVGDGARPGHRAGRAARALGVVVGVAPQLEGDGRRPRPAAQRGDGGVDAAAHGHQRALGIDRRPRRRRPPRGPAPARARRRRARRRAACRGSGRRGPRRSCGCRRARRRGRPPRARARRRRWPPRGPRRSPPPRSRRRPRGRRRPATPMRTRSPHSAPPAAASWPGTRPRPTGWRRCSSKRSSGTRPV